jgi:hypothetical protein
MTTAPHFCVKVPRLLLVATISLCDAAYAAVDGKAVHAKDRGVCHVVGRSEPPLSAILQR